MTVLMVLERLKSGALKLDDTFPVSEKAWKKGGSKMFVKVDTRVRVDDLLRGHHPSNPEMTPVSSSPRLWPAAKPPSQPR